MCGISSVDDADVDCSSSHEHEVYVVTDGMDMGEDERDVYDEYSSPWTCVIVWLSNDLKHTCSSKTCVLRPPIRAHGTKRGNMRKKPNECVGHSGQGCEA